MPVSFRHPIHRLAIARGYAWPLLARLRGVTGYDTRYDV